jgi:hypothetical protein
MQSILVNDKTKDKIIDIKQYEKIPNKKEFLLYTDNILEGITLLNYLTLDDDLMVFSGVLYQPYDQPIYIFLDDSDNNLCIKICGSFDKWVLPDDVNELKSFVDLPDYIFYSISNKKAILAGENTETASVGNSQWQREGRKIAAARIKVPFIYQTFYSGKDESLNSIREPNSFQVLNQLLYSARYKTPNFVAYFENNFSGSKTRLREPEDSQKLFSRYIKAVVLSDVNKKHEKLRKELEKEFFLHMISYLREGKYKSINGGSIESNPRLIKDLPSINPAAINGIQTNPNLFVQDLLNWIYNTSEDFESKYSLANLDYSRMVPWDPSLKTDNKKQILPLLEHFLQIGKPVRSFSSNGKAGVVKTKDLIEYLVAIRPELSTSIYTKLTLEETVIFPTRIWKFSNSVLTLSPDPESGEITAFCELLSYSLKGKKTRNVLGFNIVNIPNEYSYENFSGKDGNNKINKAISNYFDLLLLSNGILIDKFVVPKFTKSGHQPINLLIEKPISSTEEVAVVSTYLNQSTIKSDWNLCFIHTHHSSWQQIVIEGIQEKINRVSTKLDLIMQQHSLFMLAEGKDKYQSILSDRKIQQAMKNASETIDALYKSESKKINAFIYNLQTQPDKDPDFYAESEEIMVKGGIERGHFFDIAHDKNFLVIIVYNDSESHTKFKLIFSNNFDLNLKNKLEKEFL